MDGTRLNKYLSECGVCSRRAADRDIELGKVKINGKVAGLGDKVMPGDKVTFNGKVVTPEEEDIILIFNKPRGVVCTAEKKEKDNVIDYINYHKRVYPVGRLDKNSRGLLILTNNGDLVNKIMRAGNYHEKEYVVEVDKPIDDDFIKRMSNGLHLPELEVDTRPCKVKKLGDRRFNIILTQGYNRQIRRMCDVLGYKVIDLERVRIMNIKLGSLSKGRYREITPSEKKELLKLTEKSYSAPR